MKRKFLSILLTLAMALTLLPVSAMAEETPVEAPAETKVAQIGDMKYDTLQAAVDAANDGDTITLLKSGNGNGVSVPANKFINKGVTVNFNGYTYMVGGQLVGSAGTGTNAFQLNAGNKLTFKNGSIVGATEGSKPANDTPNWHGAPAIVIQNYCDLTLDNMTVTGGDETVYTMSNNCGNVVIKDTVINPGMAKGYGYGPYAFDVYGGFQSYGDVTVTVEGVSVINGNIEINHGTDNNNVNTLIVKAGTVNGNIKKTNGNLTISGGTFTSDVSAYLSSGYIQNENGAVETLGETNAVAKIGGTYYKTLADAVTAADTTTTVTLLKDTTENVTIPTGKTITLDLNGKTLSGGKNNNKAALLNNGTVTIKDSSATKTGTIKREDDADNTGTSYYVIKNLGTMTIEQANVINNSGYKKTNPSGSMVGSSLICNGDREDDKETTLTINDGVFEQQNFLAVKNGAMGILNVNGGKFTSQHSAIQNWYKADIKGGEINGQLWTDAYTWEPNGVSAGETKISGTTKFTGEIVMDITGSVKPTLEISGGEMNVTNWRITSAAANAGAKPVITGGLFSSNPNAYVPDTHHVEDSGNGSYPFAVKEGGKSDATIIVTAETNATVSETIKNEEKTKIEAVKDKANVDGVAAAIRDDKKADIAKAAGVTDEQLAGKNMIETEITVKVEAKAADLAKGKLTFEASPVATVKVNGTVKGTAPVTNSMLNGQPITVKLPLPAGFTPEQIKHISSDGSVEYFLKTAKRGAKTFEIKDDCAVFTITKFSTFELSGTITYVEPSSGSGSSSSSRRYDVSAPSVKHGDVTVSPKSASKGDTVTVTVKPDSGYVLETLTVTDKNGNELTLKDKGNGKYIFTMPAGKVEVKATFMEDNSMLNFFYDVPNGAYFYEAVKWAVENGITTGVGNDLFAPEQPCTRGQIVTFLWRAAGSPEPKGTAAGMTDVVPGSYYAKAVAWAVENGITTGTAEGTFSPDATCTRAQAVTFLARAQNAKATGKTAFSDVPADSYFADAVAWAQANGVTTGTSETTFSPDSDCTRAQIVTFLYRANQGT